VTGKFIISFFIGLHWSEREVSIGNEGVLVSIGNQGVHIKLIYCSFYLHVIGFDPFVSHGTSYYLILLNA